MLSFWDVGEIASTVDLVTNDTSRHLGLDPRPSKAAPLPRAVLVVRNGLGDASILGPARNGPVTCTRRATVVCESAPSNICSHPQALREVSHRRPTSHPIAAFILQRDGI